LKEIRKEAEEELEEVKEVEEEEEERPKWTIPTIYQSNAPPHTMLLIGVAWLSQILKAELLDS
jgi:hypothetical protein